VIVPFFPEGTMLITPLGQPNATDSSNLSIYYQEGSRRRYIKDEPENMAALVDYNSVNEGYVIETPITRSWPRTSPSATARNTRGL
jgi:hypothetical protein